MYHCLIQRSMLNSITKAIVIIAKSAPEWQNIAVTRPNLYFISNNNLPVIEIPKNPKIDIHRLAI